MSAKDRFLIVAGYSPARAGDSDAVTEEGRESFEYRRQGVIDSRNEEPELSQSLIDNGVTLYPNPANDLIYLNIPQNVKGNIQLQIFNVQGKTILEQDAKSENIEIHIGELSPGIYFLNLLGSNKKIVANFKFVKN